MHVCDLSASTTSFPRLATTIAASVTADPRKVDPALLFSPLTLALALTSFPSRTQADNQAGRCCWTRSPSYTRRTPWGACMRSQSLSQQSVWNQRFEKGLSKCVSRQSRTAGLERLGFWGWRGADANGNCEECEGVGGELHGGGGTGGPMVGRRIGGQVVEELLDSWC